MKVSFDEHPVPSKERDVQLTLLPVIASDLYTIIRKNLQLPPLIADYCMDPLFCQQLIKEKREKQSSRCFSECGMYKDPPSRVKLTIWNLSPKTKILPFHPFLDERGLLHVGGRLQKTGMPFSGCHPVLLPGKHRVTTLLIT